MNESEIYRQLCAMLEVSPTATDEEIKKAYAFEVKKWHPDRVQHNPELAALANQKIKDINQAYECLTDRVQFEKYAAKLAQKQKDTFDAKSKTGSSAASNSNGASGSNAKSNSSSNFSNASSGSSSDKSAPASQTKDPVPNPSRADVIKIFVATGIFVLICVAVAGITDHHAPQNNQGITLSPQDSPGSPITRTSYPTYQSPRPTLPTDSSSGAPPGAN